MIESVELFLRTIRNWDWYEKVRAIEVEISLSQRCVETWRGRDFLGLSYAKQHIEDLIAYKEAIVHRVREGHYTRFGG
jgi:hypothetical protein